jgi:hypothetical protein
MGKTSDLHIHTLVSDGDAEPEALLLAAKEVGLKQLSFTDHDALGAYRHFGDIFIRAKELGLELIAGIELDTDYQNTEVHLLGYKINLNDEVLNAHLQKIQVLRKQRVLLQIELINQHFKKMVVDPSRVLIPHRDTLMKPHLINPMWKGNLKMFPEYTDAQQWLAENIRVPIVVPKLPLADGVIMIHNAGGEAVLAHPGYLIREKGISLELLISELIPLGLSGLEVDYPYMDTGRSFPDREAEQATISELRTIANRFNLKATRGTDAHSVENLVKLNNRAQHSSE